MSLKSVVDIDINDAKFQRFAAQFQKVQKQIEKLPGAWRAIGTAQGTAAQQLERGGKALQVQSDETRSQLEEDKKRLGNLMLQEKLWQSMGKSSTTFFANVTGASKWLLKWSTLAGAGLIGGGLFGLDRLASRASDARSSAMGLGLSIGAQKSFNLNFGRYFGGDANGFLSGVADAAGDASKASVFYGLGIRPDPGNIEKTAITTLNALRQLAKSTDPSLFGTTVQSRHLGDIGVNSEYFRALHYSKDAEYSQQSDKYGRDKIGLDYADETARRWQNLNDQLARAGGQINRTLVDGLVKLTPSIEGLSNAASKFLQTLLQTDDVKNSITTLSMWLDNFSGKLSRPEFLNNVDQFMSEVGDLAGAIHNILHPIDFLRNNSQSTAGFKETTLAAVDKKYGLPAGTTAGVFDTESGGKMYGVPMSSAGAVGPFQFKPGTAAQYGVDPLSPSSAAEGAAHYLSDLDRHYRGDLIKALAAYNWGQGNLDKYLAKNKDPDWIRGLPSDVRGYIEKTSVNIRIENNTGGSAVVIASQLAAQ